MDLANAQHKAGERSLQMQGFWKVFQTTERYKHPRWKWDTMSLESDVGQESRRASRHHQCLCYRSHGFGHWTSLCCPPGICLLRSSLTHHHTSHFQDTCHHLSACVIAECEISLQESTGPLPIFCLLSLRLPSGCRRCYPLMDLEI